ncbi:PREDICTED: uncharacterized protein LOC109150307 [Ipomoea nil]|uniref:uncharacterized protein LOC109150307 n=1 Tax=Ipomoea nil TaxID=35883 RepID=UPI000900B5FC|nr:PREDICTED: uncharacterized protein LOC109150307 [Ipomoea nil]
MGYSNNHIDINISLDVGSLAWRFTGYYGYPERQRKRETISDCGLQDFPFSGNQFTWERSHGSPNMVEEKLGGITAYDSWLNLFGSVTTSSLLCPYSDHLPLFLIPIAEQRARGRNKFIFDNIWLREDKCREIVVRSWERSVGLDALSRVERCGRDIG